MPTCEPCAVPGHTAGDWANTTRPMCDRTCACRHGQPEPDPAPYWSATTQEDRP